MELEFSTTGTAKMCDRHHLVTWSSQDTTGRAAISYCCSLRNYPRQLQESAQLLSTLLFCYEQLLLWPRDAQRKRPTGTASLRTMMQGSQYLPTTGGLQTGCHSTAVRAPGQPAVWNMHSKGEFHLRYITFRDESRGTQANMIDKNKILNNRRPDRMIRKL